MAAIRSDYAKRWRFGGARKRGGWTKLWRFSVRVRDAELQHAAIGADQPSDRAEPDIWKWKLRRYRFAWGRVARRCSWR